MHHGKFLIIPRFARSLFWSSLNYQPVSSHYLQTGFVSASSLIDLWFLKIPRVDIWNSNQKKIHPNWKIALLKQKKKLWKQSHLQCCWADAKHFHRIFSLDFQMQMCKKYARHQEMPVFSQDCELESLLVNFLLLSKNHTLQFRNMYHFERSEQTLYFYNFCNLLLGFSLKS